MYHFKKVCASFFCVLILCSFAFSAELEHINYGSLQNIDAYRNELVFAYNHQDFFNHYTFDDYWNFNYTRAECVENLTTLYNLLLENEEPENQEYLLLKSIVASYLYNLDETSFYGKALDNFMAIQALPSYDYRCLWFFGNFYVNCTHTAEGIEQFKLVLDNIPEEYIHPEFFFNYAYALYVAGMPMSALNAYETYEKYSGKSIQSNALYANLKKLVHEYDGTDTESDMLMQNQVRDETVGVILRPFGLWFPVPENWTINISRFLEKLYILQGYLQADTEDGTEIKYSILMFSNVGDTVEETAAYQQFMSCFDRFSDVQEVCLFPNRDDIIAVEYTDSSMYAQNGGSHGFAVLVIKPWTETADSDIEIPEVYWKDSNGTEHYYTMNDFYKRYKGYAVHLLLLDSCEAIFEESKEELIEFINQCQFY